MNPDGTKLLAPAGRSPRFIYGQARYLAEALDWYVKPYLKNPWKKRELPVAKDYRIALNIGACDGLPVVTVPNNSWERRLNKLAWKNRILSQAVFVKSSEFESASLVVPDPFGLKAETVIELDPEVSSEELTQLLSRHKPQSKDMRAHMQEGKRRGVRWQTKVPVTDPMGRY